MHLEKITLAYQDYKNQEGFCEIASTEEIIGQGYSLAIPLYVNKSINAITELKNVELLSQLCNDWEQKGQDFWLRMSELLVFLDEIDTREAK